MKIPYGFCQCGCGQKTNVAKETNRKFGHVCGKPYRYLRGHRARAGRLPVTQRFWSKVYKATDDECWIWQTGKSRQGYGKFWLDGHTVPAHRVAYKLTYGSFDEVLCVCHSCDNPSCVNPRHLFLGTNADNSADMVTKNRQCAGQRHIEVHRLSYRQGEQHPNARFTEEQILEMRHLYSAHGWSQRQIAKRFGTSQPAVQRIVTYKAWKHLP